MRDERYIASYGLNFSTCFEQGKKGIRLPFAEATSSRIYCSLLISGQFRWRFPSPWPANWTSWPISLVQAGRTSKIVQLQMQPLKLLLLPGGVEFINRQHPRLALSHLIEFSSPFDVVLRSLGILAASPALGFWLSTGSTARPRSQLQHRA
jgi:hypothetical protein